MKTVYIDQKAYKLQTEVGAGQEAVVYALDKKYVAKIYRQPNDSIYQHSTIEQKGAALRLQHIQKKLKAFPSPLPQNIIHPLKMVTDKGGKVIGYVMHRVHNAETLLQYGNRSFRETNKITNNGIIEIFQKLHETIQAAHSAGVVIGDFNDVNVLIQGQVPYLIDCDSWQFGQYNCSMFTMKFADPLKCKDTAAGVQLVQPHDKNSDWYAFTVLLMKSLLFVDPYGGIHKPQDKKQKIKTTMRPLHRITVFDADVVYPRHAYTLQSLPTNLYEYFFNVFCKDLRGVFPKEFLKPTWDYCKTCGTEHGNRNCPSCQTAATVHEISYGNVLSSKVMETQGTIVYATIQNDRLVYVIHEKGKLLRENGRTITNLQWESSMKVRILKEDTIVGQHNVMTIFPRHGEPQQWFVDNVGNRPVFDSYNTHLTWIQNGDIQRPHTMGREYGKQQVGHVIANQAQLWNGPKHSFGVYYAGNIFEGYIVQHDKTVTKDGIQLPKIPGSILDIKAYISEKHIWVCIATKDMSQYENHCIVLSTDGSVLAHHKNEHNDQSWLTHIHGKFAMGPYLFCPTNEGVVRIHTENGTVESKTFADTKPYLHEGMQLLVNSKGLYVITRQKIQLLVTK